MRSKGDGLRALDALFRRKGKEYRAAMEVVLKGGELSMGERAAICRKVGCSEKTMSRVLTKLRRAGLYGVKPSHSKPDLGLPQLPQLTPPEAPSELSEGQQLSGQSEREDETPAGDDRYVTREEFKQLIGEMRALTSLLLGGNPGELPAEGYVGDAPEEPERPQLEEAVLSQASMKQMGTWVKAKNLLLFDLAREGAFAGALAGFNGYWSDFVNTVIEDYFRRMGVDIGLLSRRYL